jgi:hypothetical protein
MKLSKATCWFNMKSASVTPSSSTSQNRTVSSNSKSTLTINQLIKNLIQNKTYIQFLLDPSKLFIASTANRRSVLLERGHIGLKAIKVTNAFNNSKRTYLQLNNVVYKVVLAFSIRLRINKLDADERPRLHNSNWLLTLCRQHDQWGTETNERLDRSHQY